MFFNGRENYLRKQLPEGETRVISGRIETYRDDVQITHPDHIGTMAEIGRIKTIEPVYPMTAGLTQKSLGRAIGAAVDMAPDMPEWQDAAWLKSKGWAGWHASLHKAHKPEYEAELMHDAPRARGWPMTNFSPTSWLCRSSAENSANGPGGLSTGTGRCASDWNGRCRSP